MALTKNNKKTDTSINVLFGDNTYLDTETFFKSKGLIKKQNSIFSQIKTALNNRAAKALFLTLCITGFSYSNNTYNVEAKTAKVSSKKVVNRGESRPRVTEKTHRSLSVGNVYNNNTYAGRIVLPAHGFLTSGFGVRWNKFHKGVDIASKVGTEIVAAISGKVSFVGWKSGYGNTIEITHNDNLVTRYAHCSKLNVNVDDEVNSGEPIALMGSTGHSTGPHLHFEVLVNGTQVNPRNYM